MPTSKKIFTVQNLTEKLKQAKSLILADYQGLNVAQMAELRRAIQKAGGEFEVVKNTLLYLASENSKLQTPSSRLQLKGPTAALWIYEENLAPLKALNDFIKENGLPKIKLGFWDDKQISPERIKELAHLPGLEELRAKLIGVIRSPALGLVNGLGWNLRQLTLVLREAQKKKSDN